MRCEATTSTSRSQPKKEKKISNTLPKPSLKKFLPVSGLLEEDRDLLTRRKLKLAVSLQGTLLDSRPGHDITFPKLVYCSYLDSASGEWQNLQVRLRPGVHWFLRNMKNFFSIHLLVDEPEDYVHCMRSLLEAEEEFFNEVVRRTPESENHVDRSLSNGECIGDALVVKMGGRSNVWGNAQTLMEVPKYQPLEAIQREEKVESQYLQAVSLRKLMDTEAEAADMKDWREKMSHYEKKLPFPSTDEFLQEAVFQKPKGKRSSSDRNHVPSGSGTKAQARTLPEEKGKSTQLQNQSQSVDHLPRAQRKRKIESVEASSKTAMTTRSKSQEQCWTKSGKVKKPLLASTETASTSSALGVPCSVSAMSPANGASTQSCVGETEIPPVPAPPPGDSDQQSYIARDVDVMRQSYWVYPSPDQHSSDSSGDSFKAVVGPFHHSLSNGIDEFSPGRIQSEDYRLEESENNICGECMEEDDCWPLSMIEIHLDVPQQQSLQSSPSSGSSGDTIFRPRLSQHRRVQYEDYRLEGSKVNPCGESMEEVDCLPPPLIETDLDVPQQQHSVQSLPSSGSSADTILWYKCPRLSQHRRVQSEDYRLEESEDNICGESTEEVDCLPPPLIETDLDVLQQQQHSVQSSPSSGSPGETIFWYKCPRPIQHRVTEVKDEWLLVMAVHLKRLHQLFFSVYDHFEGRQVASVNDIITFAKSKVLKGARVRIRAKPDNYSDLYDAAQTLGAKVAKIVTQSTTHLVVSSLSQVKYISYRKRYPKLAITSEEWLLQSLRMMKSLDVSYFGPHLS